MKEIIMSAVLAFVLVLAFGFVSNKYFKIKLIAMILGAVLLFVAGYRYKEVTTPLPPREKNALRWEQIFNNQTPPVCKVFYITESYRGANGLYVAAGQSPDRQTSVMLQEQKVPLEKGKWYASLESEEDVFWIEVELPGITFE